MFFRRGLALGLRKLDVVLRKSPEPFRRSLFGERVVVRRLRSPVDEHRRMFGEADLGRLFAEGLPQTDFERLSSRFSFFFFTQSVGLKRRALTDRPRLLLSRFFDFDFDGVLGVPPLDRPRAEDSVRAVILAFEGVPSCRFLERERVRRLALRSNLELVTLS